MKRGWRRGQEGKKKHREMHLKSFELQKEHPKGRQGEGVWWPPSAAHPVEHHMLEGMLQGVARVGSVGPGRPWAGPAVPRPSTPVGSMCACRLGMLQPHGSRMCGVGSSTATGVFGGVSSPIMQAVCPPSATGVGQTESRVLSHSCQSFQPCYPEAPQPPQGSCLSLCLKQTHTWMPTRCYNLGRRMKAQLSPTLLHIAAAGRGEGSSEACTGPQ